VDLPKIPPRDGDVINEQVEYSPPPFSTIEHRFTFHPRTELPRGWYEISYDAVDLPFTATMGQSTPAAHRFHVGSLPVVLSPSFAPGETQIVVSLNLSERVVHDGRSEAMRLEVWSQGRRLDCVETEGADTLVAEGSDELTVSCPLFPLDEEVVLRIASGILGVGGAELTMPFEGGTGRELRVVPTSRERLVVREDVAPRRLAPRRSRVEGGPGREL
jgi:hypothetical protein